MRNLFTIAIVVAALFNFSCTKKEKMDCMQAAAISASAANKIATVLDCADPAAISASIMHKVQDLKLCEEDEAAKGGVISGVVCPPISKIARKLATSTLPAAWQCKGGAPGDLLEKAVLEACSVAIPK